MRIDVISETTTVNRTLFARLFPQPDGHTVQVELFMERCNIGAMRYLLRNIYTPDDVFVFSRRGPSLSLRLAQNGHAKHS